MQSQAPAASPSAFASLSSQSQSALARPARADDLASPESSFGSILASRTTAQTALTRPSRSTSPGVTNPADSARALLAQGRKSSPLATDVAAKLTRPTSPDADGSAASPLARRASKSAAGPSQERTASEKSSPEDRAARVENADESNDSAEPNAASPRQAASKPSNPSAPQSESTAGAPSGQANRAGTSDGPSGTNPDGQRRGDQQNQSSPGRDQTGQDPTRQDQNGAGGASRDGSGQPQDNRHHAAAADQTSDAQDSSCDFDDDPQSAGTTDARAAVAGTGAPAGSSTAAPAARVAQVARSIGTIGHLNAELLRRSTLSVTSINQLAMPAVVGKLLREQGGPPITASAGSSRGPAASSLPAPPNPAANPPAQPFNSPSHVTAPSEQASRDAEIKISLDADLLAAPSADPSLIALADAHPAARPAQAAAPAPPSTASQPSSSPANQPVPSALTPPPSSASTGQSSDNSDAHSRAGRFTTALEPSDGTPESSSAQPTRAGQASTSSAPSATLGAQVDRAVASIYRQVEQRPLIAPGPVTVRLRPEGLGQLRIKMDLRDSGISLRFEVGTAEAHRQLTEHSAKLADSLGAKGVSLQSVAVTIDPSLSRPESTDQPAPANTGAAPQPPTEQQLPFNQSSTGQQSRDGHPGRDPRSHRGGFFDAALLIPRKA